MRGREEERWSGCEGKMARDEDRGEAEDIREMMGRGKKSVTE